MAFKHNTVNTPGRQLYKTNLKLGVPQAVIPSVPTSMPTEYQIYQNRLKSQKLIERETHYSLLDPILNRNAKERLARGTFYEGWNPLAKWWASTAHGYLDILKRNWNFREPSKMVMNTLRTIGDTLDAPSLLIKPLILSHTEGLPLSQAYEEAFGWGSTGRHNYTFERINEGISWIPDNMFFDLLGELIVDPMNWISLGAGLIPDMATTGAMKITKTVGDDALLAMFKADIPRSVIDVSEELITKSARTIVSKNADDLILRQARMMKKLNKNIWRGQEKEFVETVVKQSSINAMEGGTRIGTEEAVKLYKAAVEELGAKRGYKLLYKIDEFEMKILKGIWKSTPGYMVYRGGKAFHVFRNGANAVDLDSLIKVIDKNKDLDITKYSDFTTESLEENVVSIRAHLKKLAEDTTTSDEEWETALTAYREAEKQLSTKQLIDANVEIDEKIVHLNNLNKKLTNDMLAEVKDSDKYKYFQAQIRANQEKIARHNAQKLNPRDVKKAIEKIKVYIEDPTAYKGSATNLTDLGKLEDELFELKLQREALKKSTDDVESAFKTLQKQIHDLEQKTGLIKAVSNLLEMASRNGVQGANVIRTLSTRANIGVAQFIKKSSSDIIKKYQSSLKANMDELTKYFEQTEKYLEENLIDMVENLTDKEELIEEFTNAFVKLRMFDDIQKADKAYEELLSKANIEMFAKVRGEIIQEAEVKGNIMQGIVRAIWKDIEFTGVDKNANKKQEAFMRALYDILETDPDLAKMFKTIKSVEGTLDKITKETTIKIDEAMRKLRKEFFPTDKEALDIVALRRQLPEYNRASKSARLGNEFKDLRDFMNGESELGKKINLKFAKLFKNPKIHAEQYLKFEYLEMLQNGTTFADNIIVLEYMESLLKNMNIMKNPGAYSERLYVVGVSLVDQVNNLKTQLRKYDVLNSGAPSVYLTEGGLSKDIDELLKTKAIQMEFAIAQLNRYRHNINFGNIAEKNITPNVLVQRINDLMMKHGIIEKPELDESMVIQLFAEMNAQARATIWHITNDYMDYTGSLQKMQERIIKLESLKGKPKVVKRRNIEASNKEIEFLRGNRKKAENFIEDKLEEQNKIIAEYKAYLESPRKGTAKELAHDTKRVNQEIAQAERIKKAARTDYNKKLKTIDNKIADLEKGKIHKTYVEGFDDIEYVTLIKERDKRIKALSEWSKTDMGKRLNRNINNDIQNYLNIDINKMTPTEYKLIEALIFKTEIQPLFRLMQNLNVLNFFSMYGLDDVIKNMQNRIINPLLTMHKEVKLTGIMRKELARRSYQLTGDATKDLKVYLHYEFKKIFEQLNAHLDPIEEMLFNRATKELVEQSTLVKPTIFSRIQSRIGKEESIFNKDLFTENATDHLNRINVKNINGSNVQRTIEFKNATYCTLDFEAKGLPYHKVDTHKPYQLAVVIEYPNGEIVRKNWYIQMPYDYSITEEGFSGITREAYLNDAVPYNDVMNELNELMTDEVIMLAHNGFGYDHRFFAEAIDSGILKGDIPMLDSVPLTKSIVVNAKVDLEKEIAQLTKSQADVKKKLIGIGRKRTKYLRELREANEQLKQLEDLYTEDLYRRTAPSRKRYATDAPKTKSLYMDIKARNEELIELQKNNAKATKDLKNKITKLNRERQTLEEQLQDLAKKYKKYNKVENYKEEHLVRTLLGEEYENKLAAKLEGEFGLDKVSNHNAMYDTAALHELLVGGKGELRKFLKQYDIKSIEDLNKHTNMLFDAEELTTLKGYHGKNGALKDIFEEFEIKFGNIDNADYGVDSFYRDNINSILESFKNLEDALNAGVFDYQMYSKSMFMIDDMLSNNKNLVKKDDVFISVNSDLRNLDTKIRDIYAEMQSIHDAAYKRQQGILDAFYGEGIGYIRNSQLFNHIKIASAWENNLDMSNVMKMFKGVMTGDSNLDEISRVYRRLYEEEVRKIFKANLAEATTDAEKFKWTIHEDSIKDNFWRYQYMQHAEPNELTRALELFKDIEDYMSFQEEMFDLLDVHFKYLNKTSPGTIEENRLVFHKTYDFMRKIDKKFSEKVAEIKRLQSLGEEVDLDLDELSIDFLEQLYDSSLNKHLNDPRLKKGLREFYANSRIGAPEMEDPITKYFNYALKVAKKSINGNYNRNRILLNPDTLTSNDFYHFFKEHVLDVIYPESKSILRENLSALADGKDFKEYIKYDSLFTQARDTIKGALSGMREPLSDIKYDKDLVNPVHIGSVRKYLMELKEAEGAKGIAKTITGEWELPSWGTSKIVQYSEMTKQMSKKSRVTYMFLQDLTEPLENIAPYKGDPTGSPFYDMMQRLTNAVFKSEDITVERLAVWATSNLKRTPARIYKSEKLDNLLEWGAGIELFDNIYLMLKELEEWSSSKMFSYLKHTSKVGEDLIDPKMAEEFMSRLKAAIVDALENNQIVEYRKAMSEFFENGGSEAIIKRTNTQTVVNVSRYFNNSYQSFRGHFKTPEEMYNFLKTSMKDHTAAIVVPDATSRSGWRIKRYAINKAEDVTKLDEILARVPKQNLESSVMPIGFIDNHTFQQMEKMLQQKFKFKEGGIPELIRRYLLMPLKSTMLLTANFAFNNIVDINLKNLMVQEGGIFSPQSVMGDLVSASKFHKLWQDYFRMAEEVLYYGNYGHTYKYEWVDAYKTFLHKEGKLTEEIIRDLEIVKFTNEFLETPAAASEITDLIMRAKGGHIGSGKNQSALDKIFNKTFYGSDYSPFAFNMKVNGDMEAIGRLALHINDLKKGLTVNESLNKILRTHFNYANKTKDELMLEFAVPFVSYPVRSFMFWQEAFFENPTKTKVVVDAIMFSWGTETLSENDYAEYQASRGNLPLGEHALQTGLTFMDALSAPGYSGKYGALPDQVGRKLNPIIKNLMFTEGRSPSQVLQRMPGVSQYGNFKTAIAEPNNVNTLFPSISSPYYNSSQTKYYHNLNMKYRNPNLSKPYSFYNGQLNFKGSIRNDSIGQLRYRWTDVQALYRR